MPENYVAERQSGSGRCRGIDTSSDKEIVWGEPAALSLIFTTTAVCAPNAVGAKCPWMVQLAPTGRSSIRSCC